MTLGILQTAAKLGAISCVVLLSATVNGAGQAVAEPGTPPYAERLRGVFLEQGETMEPGKVVGRLGIRLIEDGQERLVSVHHPFRTGDRFRFEVSSNLNGRVWIHHRSGDGNLQLLWPPMSNGSPGEGGPSVSNLIEAFQRSIVPKPPGRFAMGEAPGEEIFVVSIDYEQQAEPKSNPQIKNIKVRGAPEEIAYRGVTYDPGARQEDDPYLYFTASKQDDSDVAAVRFRLKHVAAVP